MSLFGWAALILLGVLALGGLFWWLLIETEGVYLGRRVVVWLYDVFAPRYDRIKDFDATNESLFLAAPLMSALHPQRAPLLLDIATGTARLPLALLRHTHFEGRVIGVDLSRKMLESAAYNLADDLATVDLLHAPADCLPFPDNTFDGVTFLEALEFVDEPHAALAEAVRVLRPGGVLLTTLRVNIRTMPGKLWSQPQMRATLKRLDMEQVTFEAWQEEYVKVWARKCGASKPVGAQPIEHYLRCPVCEQVAFTYTPPTFICGSCGARIRVGADGVLKVAEILRC